MKAPVWIQPGHVDGSITVHLGYGRTKAGRSGTGMGFNPYGLRRSSALWHDTGLEVKKADGEYEFAAMQNDGIIPNSRVLDPARHIIHKGTIGGIPERAGSGA